jgi:hypothetical protein
MFELAGENDRENNLSVNIVRLNPGRQVVDLSLPAPVAGSGLAALAPPAEVPPSFAGGAVLISKDGSSRRSA